LLIQTIGNIQNSAALSHDKLLVTKVMTLIAQCDVYAMRFLEKMSIHEFVTIASFYLQNAHEPAICSKSLSQALMFKILDSMVEFNEL
jgi:hypothetical protein